MLSDNEWNRIYDLVKANNKAEIITEYTIKLLKSGITVNKDGSLTLGDDPKQKALAENLTCLEIKTLIGILEK